MRVQVEMTEQLQDYVESVSPDEPGLMRELRKRTDELPLRLMQVSPEEGQFLNVLVRALGVRRAIEVGVFTGYSLVSTAMALPEGGVVVGCDDNPEWTAIAMEFCERAGVADKVDMRLGDAVATLTQLVESGAAGTFDFVFIDADKENYGAYFELALTLLRQGGLILVDNVLWHGAVIDESAQDDETTALRAFNLRFRDDARVELCLLPFADGLTFAVKR
ncbi:class I SAM-dependent methyltransferase [Kibdelosporangium phytohabitans]|uniref:Methyltransferase n=1 Tax=Kibdelosporangium phytohabitans TaxID=860235 RepID=A0A0N9I541_9PSEU|nr:class I SAM-dependent methyltransferase [Kibdelosporangium phytohabitans]ALG09962.1 methyltransferase [Kibdelosporangium phytohabitans]MBE1468623.1 caffeoyl-CoA O-methyltransferase [Kibdelosporangium phytohabitans]